MAQILELTPDVFSQMMWTYFWFWLAQGTVQIVSAFVIGGTVTAILYKIIKGFSK